ncbi:phage tail assembly chaperone [Polymorphobacter multimanifer]
MGAAVVHLGWTPAAFWRATPHEFFAAQEAIQAANEAREQAMRDAGR